MTDMQMTNRGRWRVIAMAAILLCLLGRAQTSRSFEQSDDDVPVETAPKRRALCIGINNYPEDTGYGPLKFAAADAAGALQGEATLVVRRVCSDGAASHRPGGEQKGDHEAVVHGAHCCSELRRAVRAALHAPIQQSVCHVAVRLSARQR
jgi:hypothetical protein